MAGHSVDLENRIDAADGMNALFGLKSRLQAPKVGKKRKYLGSNPRQGRNRRRR